MKRIEWFKQYFLKGRAWRYIYLIFGLHFLVFLTQYIGMPPQLTISLILVSLFIVPLVALIAFVRCLINFSDPDNKDVSYPNDTFTIELVKTIPYLATSLVFVIPIAKALVKYHLSQNIPVTFSSYVFVYGYSINFWLFFQMSRLLVNRKTS